MRLRRLVAPLLVLCPVAMLAQRSPAALRAEIDAFNDSLHAATLRMDNAATLALWDDEGVSLTPNAKALVGKAAIRAFLDEMIRSVTGARMQSFELRCTPTSITESLATEWCVEHQIVRLVDSSTFNGWGKMALVLRRRANGRWTMLQETWVPSAPEPDGAAPRSPQRSRR